MQIKKIIEKEFDKFIKYNNLNIKLSYDMPNGYENAFGAFDIVKDTLYINIKQNISKVRLLFTFFHELRHSEQYYYPQKFSKEIQNSINYVVLYNGDCYKLLNKEWKYCSLSDKNYNLIEIYKNLPYEIDANNFAFESVKKLIGKDEKNELENIFSTSLSNKKIAENELNKIFRVIDLLCE